mmetsp:Transcript_31234/g.90794  ORF Transcript_31234/g.90794 Transcript_31234/m.90794 type:complete len:319 (+) Transcript_31234:4587-5543(+)
MPRRRECLRRSSHRRHKQRQCRPRRQEGSRARRSGRGKRRKRPHCIFCSVRWAKRAGRRTPSVASPHTTQQRPKGQLYRRMSSIHSSPSAVARVASMRKRGAVANVWKCGLKTLHPMMHQREQCHELLAVVAAVLLLPLPLPRNLALTPHQENTTKLRFPSTKMPRPLPARGSRRRRTPPCCASAREGVTSTVPEHCSKSFVPMGIGRGFEPTTPSWKGWCVLAIWMALSRCTTRCSAMTSCWESESTFCCCKLRRSMERRTVPLLSCMACPRMYSFQLGSHGRSWETGSPHPTLQRSGLFLQMRPLIQSRGIRNSPI